MEVSIEEITTPKAVKSTKTANKKPAFTFKQHGNITTQNVLPQIQPQLETRFTEIPHELKRNIKPTIFRLMSIPAKEKAALLNAKLNTSEFMNKYIDSYLYVDNIKYINDHAKFGLCYLFNYIEAKFCSPININEQHNNERREPTNNQ